MSRGIDISNFSQYITPRHIDELRAQGVEWAIPGTQKDRDGTCYTGQQCEALTRAGIVVPAVYCFLYWTDSDPAEVEFARSFGLPVRLDVEYATSWSEPKLVGELHRHREYLGGYLSGIYTSEAMWRELTGNCQDFADLPLWDAWYPLKEGVFGGWMDAPRPSFHPYGGWTKAAIWQFASSGPPGVSITADWNYAEEAVVKNGLYTETIDPLTGEAGNYQVLWNAGVAVQKWGGATPGVRAKNFGGTWFYERVLDDSTPQAWTSPYVSATPGD